LFKRGQIQEACRHLERATRLTGGDDPVIWDHLGDVYRELHQPAKARQAWEKAIQLFQTKQRAGLEDRGREVHDKLRLLNSETQLKR
jgi:Flp pilus assembly protein TadD